MDSHEIPLAVAEKLQNALPVRFGLLGPAQFRDFGCLRPQYLAHGRTRDSQDSRNLPFAHSLCVQFQDRGPLRLAQHSLLAPFRFGLPNNPVDGVLARSAAAPLRVAQRPSLSPPRRPVGDERGSQSPPPSPDRVTTPECPTSLLSAPLAA